MKKFNEVKVVVALRWFWGTRRTSGYCSQDDSLPLWSLLRPIRKWFEAVLRSVKPGLVNDPLVMINLIWCISFSHIFYTRWAFGLETQDVCWFQVNQYLILIFFKSLEICPQPKVEFIDALERRLIQWLLSASCFWRHCLLLTLLSYTSQTNPPTYLPTYHWSLYTSTIMYNTVQILLLETFSFSVFWQSLWKLFFFFFCNALAGRCGSYQTRKLTHYLLPLFLLQLRSPLRYSKLKASRSQYSTTQTHCTDWSFSHTNWAAVEAETSSVVKLSLNWWSQRSTVIWIEEPFLFHSPSCRVANWQTKIDTGEFQFELGRSVRQVRSTRTR